METVAYGSDSRRRGLVGISWESSRIERKRTHVRDRPWYSSPYRVALEATPCAVVGDTSGPAESRCGRGHRRVIRSESARSERSSYGGMACLLMATHGVHNPLAHTPSGVTARESQPRHPVAHRS